MLNKAELQDKTPSELKNIIVAAHKKIQHQETELKKIIITAHKKLQKKEDVFQEKEKHFKTELESKHATIQQLYEEIRLLRHGKFGARSEKYIDDNHPQGRLFDEARPLEDPSEIEAAEATISVPAPIRKKPGRKPLPNDLPRIEVIHDLNDDEKKCTCGCALTCIGDERSEQLDIVPAKIQVLVHVHKKYACKGCKDTIKTAQKPKQPIPQSIARYDGILCMS